MTVTIPLNAAWRLLPVDVFRQGFYPLDDEAWVEQDLPAHWQQHSLFERYVGKMVYRKRFTLDKELLRDHLSVFGSNTRYWLRLNGIFYWSQCYFNGVDLGHHEGYFVPQEHEVTPWISEENTLIVEVDCPDEHNKVGKRLITGVFSHWDCIDPLTNPGGIWLPVELIATGPARVQQVLLHTERVSETVAELRFRATFDMSAADDVTLRWTIAPHNFIGAVQVVEQRRAMHKGVQEVSGLVQVRDPQLWWTHDMGYPHCYTCTLAVVQDGEISDEYTCTFGIRKFEFDNWIAYLNDVRLFIKGNNYAPGDVRIASMTSEDYKRDMELARACHMNMLRVHGHVEHPSFYAAADEAGILLWQDFPLQWLYHRSVLPEARRQAQAMVRLLYNHPSIVVWCMHNEAIFVVDLADERTITKLRTYVSVFAWNWNRDVMDTQLKRVAKQEDHTRPVIRSSGEYAVPWFRPGTDAHFYYGWFTIYGPLRAWEDFVRRFPNNIRFVTEFGAQSFPNIESSVKFMDADIAKIDWQRLADRHQFLPGMMGHWLEWREAQSLEALVDMSQEYQIAINRFYIDRLRYYKYRPTGGILPFMFRDTSPAVQSSIIDYWGVPKRSYDAMQLAFNPQYVFTLIAQDSYPVGSQVDLPIYVVNDAHQDVSVDLTAHLVDPNGVELGGVKHSLTLLTDCIALEVERLRLTPEMVGTYRLVLALRIDGAQKIEQTYEVIVRSSP